MTIKIKPHWCPSHQFILLTQAPIPEIFAKKYWELMVLKNSLFLSQPFWNFFFQKNLFLLHPMKSSQSFLGSKDGSKFWWLTWFPPHEVLGQHLCTGLYISFLLLACNTKLLDMKWKDTQQQQKKPISKNSIHYSISREHYGTLLLILSFFSLHSFQKVAHSY